MIAMRQNWVVAGCHGSVQLVSLRLKPLWKNIPQSALSEVCFSRRGSALSVCHVSDSWHLPLAKTGLARWLLLWPITVESPDRH
jgi:hypothetical protein